MSFSLADDPKDSDKPEPPVRLKKKLRQPKADEPEKKADDKPEAKPDEKQPEKKTEKVKDGKGDDPAATPDDEDAKEIVTRIGKNMRSAEDRLAKKDPGEGTRQIQRDILKDLDGLIEQSKRQQQQQQQQNARDQQQDQDQQQQSSSKKKRQSAGKKPGQEKEKDKQNAQNNPQGGGRSPEGGSKVADLYKDIWGHLPETLRQEMDAYSREQFMAKYQDLLKQYYATIAEKGRKSRD